MGSDLSALRRGLAAAGLAAALSGCAGLDRGLEGAEAASAELTERSISWICNRMSLRQWRESFGRQSERAAAWHLLCGQSRSAPAPAATPRSEPQSGGWVPASYFALSERLGEALDGDPPLGRAALQRIDDLQRRARLLHARGCRRDAEALVLEALEVLRSGF